MRVAVSCHLVRSQNFGVGKTILGLVRGLGLTKADNKLLLCHAPMTRQALATSQVELLEAPRWTHYRGGRLLWEQLFLPSALQARDVDLLHAPGYVAPLKQRVPTVVTIHDLFTLTHPEFCRTLNVAHYRALLERSARQARRIITYSEAVRRQVVEVLGVPESRVSTVHPGVAEDLLMDLPASRLERIRAKYVLARPYILWVGNLEPKKNIPVLLEAYQRARNRGLQMELVMAGGAGWGTVSTAAMRSAGARWLGYVPETDLPGLFRAASAFTFPSIAEGFGVPVLEAIALGVPVISSRIPAAEEIAPEAVRFIEPTSPADLAQAFLEVAEGQSSTWSARAEAAQRRARRMTWASHAARMWEIYAEVQDGRSATSPS